MDKISRNNYELFFIDYFEGNLSSEQSNELFLFLDANPDLREEFNGFENIELDNVSEVFDNKDLLKRTEKEIVNSDTIDEFCVAEMEGDLSDQQIRLLNKYVEEEHYDKSVFKKTILDVSDVRFEDKDLLKKSAVEFSKSINTENVDEFMVAYHEGDLDESRKKELIDFINKEKLQKDFDQYKQLFLSETNIVFDRKSQLKKFTIGLKTIKRAIPYISVAASIILFVLLFNTTPEVNNNIAEVEKKEIKKEPKKENQENNISDDIEKKDVPVSTKQEKGQKPPQKNILREKQELKPINNKSQSVISFEGKIQFASIIQDKRSVQNVPVSNDMEFEEILASNSKQKEEYLKINELIAQRVKKAVKPEEKDLNKKLSIWDIAEAGVKGASKLTGKKYELNTDLKDDGTLSALAFNSKSFEFSRTKRQ